MLGRSMNQSVPFHLTNAQKMRRYNFVESTLFAFWKKLQQSFLWQMAYYKKWKLQKFYIQPGGAGLLEDRNAVSGLWKLGIVKKVYQGRDTLIRGVEVGVVQQDGSKTLLSRPIQTLVLIVPENKQV